MAVNGVNCWLLRKDDRFVLVDTGTPAGFPRLQKKLARLLKKGTLTHIVLTHHHAAHAGGLRLLRKCYPQARLVSAAPLPLLEREASLPVTLHPRWAAKINFLRRFLPRRYPRLRLPSPWLEEDIHIAGLKVLGDFAALPTPGHTSDSLTLLLDDLLFTGDALTTNGLPVAWENGEEAQNSLFVLRQMGAKTICPGHGRAFKAAKLEKALQTETKAEMLPLLKRVWAQVAKKAEATDLPPTDNGLMKGEKSPPANEHTEKTKNITIK